MRGDQLARQWRVIRAIEASLKGLTLAETSTREGAQEDSCRGGPLQKPIPITGMGFFIIED